MCPHRVAFYIELPFDARVPAETTVTFRDGPDPFPGYEAVELAPLPWSEATTGLYPSTSLYFRRATGSGRVPLVDAHKAFGPELSSDQGTFRRIASLVRYQAAGRRRFREARSVVQLVRLVTRPGPDVDESVWLTEQFDSGMEKLNEYLVSLAVGLQDDSVGPVHRMQLPMGCYVQRSDVAADPSASPSSVVQTLFHLNWGAPGLPLATEEDLNLTAWLAGERHGGRQPFFPSSELALSASRSLAQGRTSQAVLESSIGVELLVNTVIRELGGSFGYSDTKQQRVLDAPFASRVRDHFAVMLGFDREIRDGRDRLGEWWTGAYALRTRVAHEGYRPVFQEARDALRESQDLFLAVKVALWQEPRASELAPVMGSRPNAEELARAYRA